MAKKRIYPVLDANGDPAHYIPGIPAQELLLETDEADALLAYRPEAFTTKRPPGQHEPSPDVLETLPAGLPPTSGPAPAGPSDSERD